MTSILAPAISVKQHRREFSAKNRWRTQLVHDVANPFSAPAVSIHAYSPPLSRMTFYEQGVNELLPTRTEWVSGPERQGSL